VNCGRQRLGLNEHNDAMARYLSLIWVSVIRKFQTSPE
jgi:hypothetical protein